MKKLTTFLLLVFAAVNLAAQQPVGLPFITQYSPLKTHYSGEATWILQGNDGVMYFGTWDRKISIEQYDGVSWTEALQNQNIHGHTRAAAKDSSGTIFYGGSGDFGYLSHDSLGNTICVSLLKYVPKNKRDFADIYSVNVAGNNIYFQSGKRLFRLTKTGKGNNIKWGCKTWESQTYFQFSTYIDRTLYVQERRRGLFKLINDSLQLISDDSAIAKLVIMAMLPHTGPTSRREYLIATFNQGLYLFDGAHFSPFRTEADKILEKNSTETALMVNGNYILGTMGAGIIIMNPQGKVLQVINKKAGLPGNTVMVFHWDGHHNLWAVTSAGICRLEINSPFTRFSDQPGINSLVESIGNLPDGSFYVGGQGVAKYNPATNQFESMPSLIDDGDVNMLRDGDQLILGGSKGQYALRGDNAVKIPEGGVKTDAMLISKKYPNLLCAGTTLGLVIFIRDKSHPSTGGWKGFGLVRETSGEVIHWIAEQPDGRLWITNDLGNIMSRITLSVDKNGIPDLSKTKVEEFRAGKAFNDNMNAVTFKNKTFYFGDSSVYSLNEAAQKFVKDTVLLSLGDTLDSYRLGVNGIVWLLSQKGEYNYFTSSETGEKYRMDSSAWILLRNYGLQQAIPGDNGIIWGSVLDGLIRYDTKIRLNDNTRFNVLIRKVTSGKQVFNPFLSGKDAPEIKFSHNTFRFDFAAPFFIDESQTSYQTKLQGFDTGWSAWSENAYKEYTNLPHGHYVFHVRAKNVFGSISNEADYSFNILPPWWQTWWAYLVYAFLLVACVWGFVSYRSRNLKRKNQELEKKVSLRTNELSQSLENLKSTQKQLIQSEKMASLGELTAGIAHEIQNPLNFVNNFSEVNTEIIEELKAERLKPQEERDEQLEDEIINDIKENSEKINHHGKRAGDIVKGMLQHSRTSSGQKEPTDINALCDEYLRLSYHGLRAKDKSFNATMKTDFDETIGKINVVPQDIGRVLLNIINNAFFAVNERHRQAQPDAHYEPTVTVSTKKVENSVTVTVRDNGNGIPDKIKDKIFQPFFTTKPTGQGTGLGLSLAYDIVKAHGGDLKVESREGEGTEFTIQLPA